MRAFYHGYALGTIETEGLLASIEAADAMVKAAEIELVRREQVGGGIVTLMVAGDLASVTAAVRAAEKALRKVGGLLSTHIIPCPDDGVWDQFVAATHHPRRVEDVDPKEKT